MSWGPDRRLGAAGADAEDVLMQESKAGVLKPSFIMVRDRTTRKILLAVRGTHSMKVSCVQVAGTPFPSSSAVSTSCLYGATC